jgi:hypothetical protein
MMVGCELKRVPDPEAELVAVRWCRDLDGDREPVVEARR